MSDALVGWALARGRMMAALLALALAAGFTAYATLPKEGAPNIDIPTLYISTALDGASSEDVERLILKPLERELRDLQDVKHMDAFASDGFGAVLLEFQVGWNRAISLAETRDRVSRAQADMPDAAEEAQVLEISLSDFPVLIVSVSGDAPERARLNAARDLKRAIEGLSSVISADIAGARDEAIEAVIDPLALETSGTTLSGLAQIVRDNNRLVAAGALEQGAGATNLFAPGNLEDPADAARLPVRVDGEKILRLGDIAEIRRVFKDPEGTARFNGAPTIALQVKKRAAANIIDTVAEVKAAAAAAAARWPEPLQRAITVDFSMDLSNEVRSMVSQLEASVLTAVLLVTLVVVATLGPRSSLLIGLAVPSSFLIAFALFGALGYGVNNMVMFGLILAVGMLVDGAIVVAEFAERRMAEGTAPPDAYREAASRMFWPIVSSTATTLSAFMPMLFWPGMAGEFMRLLPVTLVFVLCASLVVAILFLPVMGSGLAQASVALFGRGGRRRARRSVPGTGARRATAFGRFTRWIIAKPLRPFGALAAAVLAVWGAFAVYATHDGKVEFFVETEPERAVLQVRAIGDFSVKEKDRLVWNIERRVLEVDGVGSVFAFAGEGGLPQFGGSAPPDSIGQLQIELEDWKTRFARGRYGAAILEDIRAAVADVPGVRPELRKAEDGPQQGKPVQLLVGADDPARLETATVAMRALFDRTDGLVAIDDSRPPPGLRWRLDIDRDAAGRFGADIAQVTAAVQLATLGVTLDQTTPDDSDEEIDVIARFPPEARTLAALDGLRIATSAGSAPLSNFVTRTPEPSVGAIARRDGQRFFLVRADVAPDANANTLIETLTTEIDAARAEDPARFAGVELKFVGDQQEQAETMVFLGYAFLGALGLMFVILLAQFNSFYNTVLVLSAVVMSIGGVLIGMVVMDQDFSIIMTGTGIVALAGIVVNNNIVLIDSYRDYARRMGRLEAIARTAEDRFRPVLLTTITTIAGLAPMMAAASIDFRSGAVSVGAPSSLWWIQLATAVIFGLAFATLLTLIATPAALAARVWVEVLVARYWGALTRWSRGRRGRAAAADADVALRAGLPTGPVEILWETPEATTPDRARPVAAE